MTYDSSVKLDKLFRSPSARGSLQALACAALVFLALGFSGCSKLKARDLQNKGVQAFKNGQYDNAIEFFKQAKDLDPNLLNARLFLATAYASQYIPGAPSDANMKLGTQAIAEFKDVLSLDANNLSAIDGLGSLYYQMAATPYDPKKFEESKGFHERHIQLKPNDPEPYYWIAAIDWTLAQRINLELRQGYNRSNLKKQVQDTDPMPASIRSDYASKAGTLVDEGISDAQKAVQLRPDYDDAIAYLSLLYRRKADMVQSAQEQNDLGKQADALLDKVKEIKQKRAEQPQPAN